MSTPELTAAHKPRLWLFSAPVDLAAFLGSALVALSLVGLAATQGWLENETPEWTWITAVLLVDVAHVYATAFRVYFVPQELARRKWLYLLTPLVAYLLGVAVYSESSTWFWRILAYLAIFHFVRQQYGWVALYRARRGERDRCGAWLDGTTIYAATLYPLLYWHAHLPRQFWWFVADDFIAVPTLAATIAAPIYWSLMIAYVARSVVRSCQGHGNPGKDLVVLTTAVCWYLGIVALNSDFAFTVTNVLIHGVPYMVLVFWVNVRAGTGEPAKSSHAWWQHAIVFVATIWALVYAEELLWDRTLWHERSYLFGSQWQLHGAEVFLVPLLAVPQVTHYILDGFIWRRRSNPDLAKL